MSLPIHPLPPITALSPCTCPPSISSRPRENPDDRWGHAVIGADLHTEISKSWHVNFR